MSHWLSQKLSLFLHLQTMCETPSQTLTFTMLLVFYVKKKDKEKKFLCVLWLHQYPVIFEDNLVNELKVRNL